MSGLEKTMQSIINSLVFGVGLVLATPMLADDTTVPAAAPDQPAVVVPADHETTALAFAGDHHPELKSLVESLKPANPDGYRKAINELHRTNERIIRLTEKNPIRAAHELELWKIDSRLRLAAARSTMGDPEERRGELRSLVEQRRALKLKWIRDERERTASRLTKLDTELKSAEAKEAGAIDAEVDRLLKSARSKQPRVTTAHRDAKKKNKADAEKVKPADTTPTPVVEPAPAAEPTPLPEPILPSPAPEL